MGLDRKDGLLVNKFNILGYPLGHSMSPMIHNYLFKKRGLNFSYGIASVEPESFNLEIPELIKGSVGFNVTIPYKEKIIPFLSELCGRAKTYGAVNTVSVKDGVAKGYNTDCDGFLTSLKESGIELSGTVVLLGCGGVARMFAFEAAMAGCSIINACIERDVPDSVRICDDISNEIGKISFKTIFIDHLDDVTEEIDLLINATPVGMYPKVEGCPVSDRLIARTKAVFDAVYNPAETVLLKKAREAGAKTLGGAPMLAWQAEAAQRIWFGSEVSKEEIDELISLLINEIEEKNK